MENEVNNKNVSLSLISEYGTSDSDSDTISNEHIGNEDSDSAELSEMVLKNNIINACAHGPLSRNNHDEVEKTPQMIINNVECGAVDYEVTEYRDADCSSDNSSSGSSDSEVDSVKDIEEVSSGDEIGGNKGKNQPLRVRGELALDDLPPIEDLAISLPAQDTTKIGTIASIVDRLVIVRAYPETPAVDLDSVLFLDYGAKALGKVFDVFGPVTEPHYCVRFNSQDHMKERGIETGMDVFIAPLSQHTNYVFLTELMKIKGSDASWLHDIEPPPSQVDYSDDEEERKANKSKKEQKRTQQDVTENNAETSKNVGRKEVKRNQRPSESSSRFGGGSSRGRNPFAANSRRSNYNPSPRFAQPWHSNVDLRTPPPHPNNPGIFSPFSGNIFSPSGHPLFPPVNAPMYGPFNRPPNSARPLFMGNTWNNSPQFSNNPRMISRGMPPSFRHNLPVFGANFCNNTFQHEWGNRPPPPP